MPVEHHTQLAGPRALADDESKLLQSLSEERSNVLLVIGNADTGPDLSPAERNKLARFFNSPGCHDATLHRENEDILSLKNSRIEESFNVPK